MYTSSHSAFAAAAGASSSSSSSPFSASSSASIHRRLLELTRDLEQANKTQKRKCLKSLVDALRDDGEKYRHALDAASRALTMSHTITSATAAATEQVDWSTLLTLALTCIHGEKSKARTPTPFVEVWQCVQFLFESAERNGHFLTKHIVDTCMQEILSILHLDSSGSTAASGGSSSSSAASSEKDPLKIQGSISALSSIIGVILAYSPYASDIAQEYYHDMFALFSNTLVTHSHLTSTDMHAPHATILSIIKPYSHFPDSFLGLYQSPAAAVNILVQMILQYPYASCSSSASSGVAVRKYLASHVFPFFLSLFTLKIPDNLITRLMHALNTMLSQHAMSHLALFRDFSYKFIYAMIQPLAWPKSVTVKNELVRFVNLVMRIAKQLPQNNTLRIVEELDTAHPLYRLLFRELDTDQMFTLVGLEIGDATLQLDSSTHAFLSLFSHIVNQVQKQPEPTRAIEDATIDQSTVAVSSSEASSSTRKKRRLETDVGYSMHALWDHYNANTSTASLSSPRLISWLKFLYVYIDTYTSHFSVIHRGALLSNLVVGLSRSSERSKSEVKLWSLACLSRLASACHANGVQLTRGPSSMMLLALPSNHRTEVQHHYTELAQHFAEIVDRLIKKHLLDERKAISRMALALLTKLTNYQLIAPSQISYLQTVFLDLPALKQNSTAAIGTDGRLSNQILKKETLLMSPQPKAPTAATAARIGVKLENYNGAATNSSSAAVAPVHVLLNSEVDMVTLRFLLIYLQRFELNESTSNTSTLVSPSNGLPSSPPTALLHRQSSSPQREEALGEEDILRWILGYRYGSTLFSPLNHTLRSQWSTSQWFAATILAINRIPLHTETQTAGVCLEEEFTDDVKLPTPPSRFVHAQRPHETWLKADMGGVNYHSSQEMRDFAIQAQFVPLVSTATTPEEISLHQLPSISCQQHHFKQGSSSSNSSDPHLLSSASIARSSRVRLLTLEIISDQISSLNQSLTDRSASVNRNNDVRMDTSDRIGMEEEKKPLMQGGSALKLEDVYFAMRFYLHYMHILCHLAHREYASDESQQILVKENRTILLDLLATCWNQLATLLPHLLLRIHSPATSSLLAYAHHLMQYYERIFCSSSSTGASQDEIRCDVALMLSISAFEAACFKVLLHVLRDARSAEDDRGAAKRRLEFDSAPTAPTANSSSATSSLLSDTDVPILTDSVIDSLTSIIVRLLGWKVNAPANALNEVKQFLDHHMSMKSTVHECTYFYRLAHLHSLGKCVSRTPNPNQDLLYYLAYLSEEFFAKPPVGSSLALSNRELLHFRALGFFLDLAQSVRATLIVLDETIEEKRVQRVFEDLFGHLNTSIAKNSNPIHRYNRMLKARCAYVGVMSGLTNSWSLVAHLSLDLTCSDFVVRLFSGTQVRTVLSIIEAEPIYNTFEKKVLSALTEDKASNSRSANESYDKRESLLMTLLACLAQMGLSVQERERTILLHMCHLWRDRPSARALIALVYQQLSDCLQYQHRGSSLAPSTATQTSQLRLRSSSLFPPSSSTSLLDDQLDFILNEWLVHHHSLADFPRELLMQPTFGANIDASVSPTLSAPSFESFVRQYQARIAAILVIHHDTLDLQTKLVLESLGCDLPTLLKKHFPVCCARFYAIYSQNSHENAELTASFLAAATSCLNFFKTTMQERKFNTYYHSKLNETLCALVDLVVIDPSGPRLSSYTLANFTTSLTQLAKADQLDVPHHLCASQHDRFQSLLLYLRVRIASEFRAYRQWKLIEIVRSLILEHVGPFLNTPAVWRVIMDLLLWMLPEFDQRFPAHAHECVKILAEVTTKLISQVTSASPPAAPAPASRPKSGTKSQQDGDDAANSVPTRMPTNEMMIHVRHIITAMIEYSEAGSYKSSHSTSTDLNDDVKMGDSSEAAPSTLTTKISLVSNLIVSIIHALPESLHQELAMLPPFPSHPLLGELNATYRAIYRERNLAEEILCFLINVRSSSNPKEGATGLAHLLTQLRTHTTELSQLLQPIPPSLQSLGMELLSYNGQLGSLNHTSSGALARRTKSSTGLANPIITVDGRNPTTASTSDSIDVVSDINNSIRVSNRILSSPDHESSGHWAFDLIAPLIGALCAFCSWSENENDTSQHVGDSSSSASTTRQIRMLAVKCLGEIGAVDPYALNGHNSRVFRTANPLPPIARSSSITPHAPHPFASALLGSPPLASVTNAARLHASWYGRWYAVGGGLQASSSSNRELKHEPQAYSNDPHHLLILYLLSHHSRSNNVLVAQMAYHTLSNLMCPPDVCENNHVASSQTQVALAMTRLDLLTQAYLAPFPATKFKIFRPVLKVRSSKMEESESDVWDVSGRSVEDWICKLTRYLLTKRVRDPVLIHCAGLCSHLPEFAMRLFPYIIYDILQQADESVTQMMAMRINSALQSILSPRQSTAIPSSPTSPLIALPATSVSRSSTSSSSISANCISILKLILASLQYVREQCLIIHRQPMQLQTSKHQAAPQRASLNIASSIAINFDARIDLIKLAQSAQSCDMYATSLLYLEQWHVRTYQRINSTSPESEAQFKESLAAAKQARLAAAHPSTPMPGQSGTTATGSQSIDSSAASQDENDAYHHLLLEVYRHVSDADGIYGALHSRELIDDVTADLIISEHEGKYDTTMQIYDSIFQQSHHTKRSNDALTQPAAAVVSSSSSFSFASSGDLAHLSPISAHAGLVRSLQQLGCSHLVDRYMNDLSGTDPSAYGSIADAHYEAAWRTSMWDLQTHANTLVDVGSGLHTSLFHGLRSLHALTVHHKNVSSFDASITQARSRLVQQLSNANPETSQQVFPSIVHLQLLADMERSWSILDSPDAASNQQRRDDEMDTSDGPSPALSISHRFAQFERVGRDRLFLLFNDFDAVEPILALRGVILQLAKQPQVLAAHLRFVAAFARQSNRRVVGAHAIRSGTSDPTIPVLNKLALKLEEAQLNWSEGLVDSAIRSAKHIVQLVQSMITQESTRTLTPNEDTIKLLIDASCLAAEWMSRSQSEASNVIQRYLTHASQVVTSSQSNTHFISQQQHRCYYQLACFMDRTFQSLIVKSQSPEHEASRQLFRSNEEKIKKLNESMQDPQVQLLLRTRDSTDEKILAMRQVFTSKQMYIRRLEKEHAVDAQQNQQFDRNLTHALEQAMLNYAQCLRYGDKFDTQVVYRFIALWFNHYANAPYTAEKLHVVRQIDSIPSRKFVPLMYQIAAQLSLADAPGISPEQKLFRQNLHDLIKRMILDHPYHALYQIFALAHGDQLSRVGQSVAGGVEMNELRIRAAQLLIVELKKVASVKDLVVAQEKLIVQYIALGGYKFGSRAVEHIQLASTPLGVLKARDLNIVPVPTLTIPVRADCNYRTNRATSDSAVSSQSHVASSSAAAAASSSSAASSYVESPIVTIASFDPQIHLATSGVNVPLIIEMMCSDGKRHKQLLKSADDLRQDAVMEQLFKLVNELLSVHRATAQRQLHIRTYNVIPLTPGVGLVEWVMNTTSLAECLVNDVTGAHSRYVRPGQKRNYRQSLTYLRESHEARQTDEYTRRFGEIVQDFQPVFHRFFLEMFPAPTEWLARRTAYTRSVAVNSIVGFVVGLGDRHIHNILIDLHTSELIHIDLGVAFDMGAVLKTPEIVPFRLTRDMIDAMGVTGYEGGFRKAAEETMRVMRENREMLLTVLEVFLVDPLYKWALSPAKIQQLRPMADEDALSEEKAREQAIIAEQEKAEPQSASVNSGASRAMFNVKQRLAGAQHKQDQLSVEGQVNALIHDATDMEKLAKMYYGWSAFV